MASPGVGGSLSAASDVSLSNPTNGQVLKRDNGYWKNLADSAGGSGSIYVTTTTGTLPTGLAEGTVIARYVASGPATPTWAKPVMGTMGGSESDFQTHNTLYGPVLARRTYSGSLPSSFANSSAASDVAAGRHSYWSWKPNLINFPTNASSKAALSAFIDTIPAGHKTTIVAWHEPEDNIQAGDFTLAQWGALQNSVGAIVRSKNRSELRFGICLMGPWTFDTRSPYFTYDWDSALDWNLVDVFGIDPYSTSTSASSSLEQILTVNNYGAGTGGSAPSMMAKVSSYGKPVSLMEWGCFNMPESEYVKFINAAYPWMKSWNQNHPNVPIESAIFFDYDMQTSSMLTGAAISAYAAIVADSKIPPS